jgi:hypothetical protein
MGSSMTKPELIDRVREFDVKFVPHSKSLKMQFFGWVATRFGTRNWRDKYMLTWGKTIYHPDGVNPFNWPKALTHELIHVMQQAGHWVWLWGLKYLVSQRFRWRMEREAYLTNIATGTSIHRVVAVLHLTYMITDPTVQEMTDWFERQRATRSTSFESRPIS